MNDSLTLAQTPYPIQYQVRDDLVKLNELGVAVNVAELGKSELLNSPATSTATNLILPATINFNDSRPTTTYTGGQPSTTRSEANYARFSTPLPSSQTNAAQVKIDGTKLKDTKPVSLRNDAIFKFGSSSPIRNFSQLNRSDITELLQHSNLLTPSQSNLLHTTLRKQKLYPQRYRDDYLRHSSILLLAHGWSSALRYSMCSVPNPVNRSGQCKLHKYCPYCSYLEKQRQLARYVPCYNSGIWHFLTGSFSGELIMTGPSSYYELVSYWDSYKLALQALVKQKLIRGVFWTEELAINSISPTKVLPHIHATIEADVVDEELLQKLNKSVQANLKSVLGPDYLSPNIQVKNINSQRKLLSHLQYQIKPIKIVKAYDLAWSRALHNDRAGVVRLNSDTTELVLGYSTITKDRLKINSAGNLNPKAKTYIGTKKQEIEAARDEVKAVIKAGTDYIEIEDEHEDATENL